MLRYKLIRSRRRTVSIRITKDAGVEVRAPLKAPAKDIERFVSSKEKWINEHIARMERLNSERAAFAPNYGDKALFLGNEFSICEGKLKRAFFDGESFQIPSGLPAGEIKQHIIKIYKAEARRLLKEKSSNFAEIMGVSPSAVRVTGAKTRWGSCSGKNSVSFSWRLIMADEDVIEYVVVHELAHIKEHNHSPRFWAFVESVLPDYRKLRQRLKALHERLSRENWD